MTFEAAVHRVAQVICYEGEEAGIETARNLAFSEEDAYLLFHAARVYQQHEAARADPV